MQGILRGVTQIISPSGVANLPEGFKPFGQTMFLGLQSPFWVMITVVVLFWYLLSRTRYFRQFYYVGSNSKAATLSGINVNRVTLEALLPWACWLVWREPFWRRALATLCFWRHRRGVESHHCRIVGRRQPGWWSGYSTRRIPGRPVHVANSKHPDPQQSSSILAKHCGWLRFACSNWR